MVNSSLPIESHNNSSMILPDVGPGCQTFLKQWATALLMTVKWASAPLHIVHMQHSPPQSNFRAYMFLWFLKRKIWILNQWSVSVARPPPSPRRANFCENHGNEKCGESRICTFIESCWMGWLSFVLKVARLNYESRRNAWAALRRDKNFETSIKVEKMWIRTTTQLRNSRHKRVRGLIKNTKLASQRVEKSQ